MNEKDTRLLARMINNWRDDVQIQQAPQYASLLEHTLVSLLEVIAHNNALKINLADKAVSFKLLAQVKNYYFRQLLFNHDLVGRLKQKFGIHTATLIQTEWRAQSDRAFKQYSERPPSSGVNEIRLIELHFGFTTAQKIALGEGNLTIIKYAVETPAPLTLPHRLVRVPHGDHVWKQ